MLCPNCKKEIPDGVQFCAICGANVNAPVQPATKQKKPVTKKWWFWVIIVVVAIGLISAISGGGDETVPTGGETTTQNSPIETTKAETTKAETTNSSISEIDYKAACEIVAYKDIARQPDTYAGKNIMFTGEVMQVDENSYTDDIVLLIQVTQDEYGYWDDLVYVTYTLPDGAPRILEYDIVKFYGECEGTYTYETVMGSNNTIPSVSARYIDIQ